MTNSCWAPHGCPPLPRPHANTQHVLCPSDSDTSVLTISLFKENGNEWWKQIAVGEPDIDTKRVCVFLCVPQLHVLCHSSRSQAARCGCTPSLLTSLLTVPHVSTAPPPW